MYCREVERQMVGSEEAIHQNVRIKKQTTTLTTNHLSQPNNNKKAGKNGKKTRPEISANRIEKFKESHCM